MKAIVLGGFLSLCYHFNAQSNANQNISVDSDSTMNSIFKFSADYAKIMECWTPEKKKRFNETFVYTRGNFTIPNEPIKLKD